MITAQGTGSDDSDEQRHAANACSILALVNAASSVNPQTSYALLQPEFQKRTSTPSSRDYCK